MFTPISGVGGGEVGQAVFDLGVIRQLIHFSRRSWRSNINGVETCLIRIALILLSLIILL